MGRQGRCDTRKDGREQSPGIERQRYARSKRITGERTTQGRMLHAQGARRDRGVAVQGERCFRCANVSCRITADDLECDRDTRCIGGADLLLTRREEVGPFQHQDAQPDQKRQHDHNPKREDTALETDTGFHRISLNNETAASSDGPASTISIAGNKHKISGKISLIDSLAPSSSAL